MIVSGAQARFACFQEWLHANRVLLNDAGHIIKGIFCEMSDRDVMRTSRVTGHKPKGELSFACA